MARHHIFLSYSRQDSDIVFKLHDQLEEEGLSVWIDREGIQPGTPSWRKTIQDAIDNASCLLVVLSPDAKESHWVGEELNYAQTQGKRIFYALATGDERTSVPFGHSAAQWVDLRDPVTYSARFMQLANAVFDFLQIDSDTFKKERLRIEEERRRAEREERERRAREEAQRLAAEAAARNVPPSSHPQFDAPPVVAPPAAAQQQPSGQTVYGIPDPSRSAPPLQSALGGVPGHLHTPARAVQVAGIGERIAAAVIDYLVLLVMAWIIGQMFYGDEFMASLVILAAGFTYNWLFWTRFNGQTPGKRMTGVRVVPMSGGRISDRQAVLRALGYWAEWVVLGLGLLLAFTNRDRRTLHDFMAGTRVIKA